MSGIGFDEHVGLGAVVDVAVLIAGLGGGWATLKFMQKVTLEKLAELKGDVDKDREINSDRHDANIERMGTIELKIANECLKKDDFRDFERRFDAKIEKLEHATANAATKAAGLIVDLLRTDHRRSRDGER